jgi:hypothetical protein
MSVLPEERYVLLTLVLVENWNINLRVGTINKISMDQT